jgi:HEAT repeat protein
VTAFQAALALLSATALGCALMVALVIARKLRRDNRERISIEGRAALRQAMLSAQADVLRAAALRACDDPLTQVDFAITAADTVDQLVSGNRSLLHGIALETGLGHCLLAQLLSSDPIERGRAAFLLGELRFPESEAVFARLLSDPDPDVRLVACAELGGIATEAAAECLIAALVAEVLPAERIVERLAGRWAVPSMVSVLEDQHRAFSLAPIGQTPASGWRAAVARALGVAADPRAELTLARMLDSEDVEERVAAARALGPSGSEASVPVLIRALDDPSWEVRAQAAKSLAHHPEPAAVPVLEEHLADQAWWVRSNAADTLVSIGEDGVSALRRVLSHSDRYARERAQEALALHDLAGARA